MVISGRNVSYSDGALPMLTVGMRGLFLLKRVKEGYALTDNSYAAFSVDADVLRRLSRRQDFAPEFDGLPVGQAMSLIGTMVSRDGARR